MAVYLKQTATDVGNVVLRGVVPAWAADTDAYLALVKGTINVYMLLKGSH